MFKCTNCDYASPTKLGKCPLCGEFWCFVESVDNSKATKKWNIKWHEIKEQITKKDIVFWQIKEKELKRVLSRGIKQSALYLLGWEPGIGKSTIVLQIIQDLVQNNENIKIWYFSGEENIDQIYDRLKRLNLNIGDKIKIFHTNSLEDITMTAETNGFDIIIVDSIQTIYSNNIDWVAGSIWQVKYISENISTFSKKNWITSMIIWHVTKWWEIAWPKYLEHIVDVVLQIDGDRFGQYRFLRSQKNRFDATDEVGIFEMTLFGLKPVYDLKDRILNSANISIPWNVLTIWLDGARPVITTLEVLLNKSFGKYPQRTVIWVDSNRVNLIVAILERYLKINIWFFDIYVNIPWEFKFFDSWLDLVIACAIFWQYKNKIIDKNTIFLWELWLWWQVLKSKLHEKRLKEIPEWFEIIDFSNLKNIVQIPNFI